MAFFTLMKWSIPTLKGVEIANLLIYNKRMPNHRKHISVLVPKGHVVVDTIISPYNLLRMANSHFKKRNELEKGPYKIDLVGMNKDHDVYDGAFSIKPTTTIRSVQKTDLIIVSAISGNLEEGIKKNKQLIEWVKKQRIEQGCEVASLCKGAVLLAETGLLNNKSCTTHWTIHDEFKQRYPQVKLIPEKIIVEDKGMYSSGGAYSFLNFILYLIERLFGRETSIWISKISEIDMDRTTQGHFSVFSGQKNHKDSHILNAQIHIEKHFREKINIDELARQFAISSRNFLRRFKKATANTPMEYIQRVKIEAAKKYLESSIRSISEVMYDVGYHDEKAFRNLFKKHTGLSPMEYRNKYNYELSLN